MNNNNNRGNNNRRRGRGNRQQGGGGQQLNRIDSRARGNAQQLLEKYRKLAHDAHLNGDRVQAEYYLQFADHYFRVLADARVRQEEQRTRQPGERWTEAEDGDDGNDFGGAGDFPSFDQPAFSRPQRDDRPRRDEREEQSGSAEQDRDSAQRGTPGNPPEQGDEQDQGDGNPYEPPENPFVRDTLPRGGLRPRRERDDRPARAPRRPRDDDDHPPAGLDPASLPPAISAARDEAATAAGVQAKPRKPRARRKPSADDAGGEALETVS